LCRISPLSNTVQRTRLVVSGSSLKQIAVTHDVRHDRAAMAHCCRLRRATCSNAALLNDACVQRSFVFLFRSSIACVFLLVCFYNSGLAMRAFKKTSQLRNSTLQQLISDITNQR
jgi:hypothetical protein